MKCQRCSKGCELSISVDKKGQPLVEGASCYRGEAYALENLSLDNRTEDLTVYKGYLPVKLGYRSHVWVTSDRPIKKELFSVIDQAISKLLLETPLNKGQVVYEDSRYPEIRVLTTMGMKARKVRK